MPIFKYKAINDDKRTVSGRVEAETEEGAAETLREKGLEVVFLSSAGSGSFNINIDISRIKPKDVVIFSRQFSVLISAGVSLVSALKMLVVQTENTKFKGMISEIADDVDGGTRFSDALSKRKKIFSDFYINVVMSGETSGKLDEVLNYLADELEKDYDMNGKIKGAMIYPAFVLAGLTVVGIIMMIFVVPKLTEMMTSTGGELPYPTQVLIAVSDFLTHFWWFLALVAVGIVSGFKYIAKLEKGKFLIDTIVLKLPIFGNLLKKIYIVRFARSLNTLLIGGVTISRGLAIVANVVSNAVYKNIILDTKQAVEDGNSIISVFEKSPEIPNMVSQMMSIGEKTGKLDLVLDKITDFYTREINNIVANLMTLMEPIIMVIMGVGVGLMVAAIVLPMYQMSSNF